MSEQSHVTDLTVSTVGERILVRGIDVADGLIGERTFTEAFLLNFHGHEVSTAHARVVDATLIALMEHGITPSTLAARLVTDAAPEAMAGAFAAGLLAAGSRFLGTIEGAASFLQAIVRTEGPRDEVARACVREVLERGDYVPGFGHNLHSEDPRVSALLAVGESEGVSGEHVEALWVASAVVTTETGKELHPNAAGAAAALLSDLGYPHQQVFGFALLARAAGIFAHIIDEQRSPIARDVWTGFHAPSTASVFDGDPASDEANDEPL